MGNRNPLDEFTSRVGGPDTTSTDSSSLPNFRDELAKAQAAQKAAAQADKVGNRVAQNVGDRAVRNVLNAQRAQAKSTPIQTSTSNIETPTTPTVSISDASPTFSVTRGEQTVTRPMEGTEKQAAVAAKIGSAMEAREMAAQAAKKALAFAGAPAKDMESIDQLQSELNHGSGMQSKSAASEAIHNAIKRISPKHRALAKNALRKSHLLAFHKDQ